MLPMSGSPRGSLPLVLWRPLRDAPRLLRRGARTLGLCVVPTCLRLRSRPGSVTYNLPLLPPSCEREILASVALGAKAAAEGRYPFPALGGLGFSPDSPPSFPIRACLGDFGLAFLSHCAAFSGSTCQKACSVLYALFCLGYFFGGLPGRETPLGLCLQKVWFCLSPCSTSSGLGHRGEASQAPSCTLRSSPLGTDMRPPMLRLRACTVSST